MSERVLVHVQTPNDTWTRLGSIAPDEQPGSITSVNPGQERDIYIFGWARGAGAPGLWKCRDGAVDTTIDTDRIGSVTMA